MLIKLRKKLLRNKKRSEKEVISNRLAKMIKVKVSFLLNRKYSKLVLINNRK